MSSEHNTSLPISKLPPEWQQRERLDVLFGPVRNKYVNSFNWENKLKFWKESIESYCTHNQVYVFNLHRLERAFLHNNRTPACIKDILDELIHIRDVIPQTEFLQRPETTWTGWATNALVKRPISWTFNKMKSSIVTTNITNVEFVHHKVVKQEAKNLLEGIPDNFLNTVVELRDFAKGMGYIEIDPVKILLHQLEKEGKVSMRNCVHDGKQLLLLRFANVTKALEDVDVQIYILTKEEEMLQRKVQFLENKLKDFNKEIKNHLLQGNKHMAKTILKKRKLQEKSIESLEKNAHNVSQLLHNLEDAAHNHHVFKTYQVAIDNLKTNLEKLNIDNVDETMAQLSELVDTSNDIQTTLGQSVDGSAEEDLEAELAALMAEDNDETPNESPQKPAENVEDEVKLPSVPVSPTAPEENPHDITAAIL